VVILEERGECAGWPDTPEEPSTMRALTATIVTTLFLSTACVGGPGPLPTTGDGEPGEQVQTGGSAQKGDPSSGSSSSNTPAACVIDQCPELSCTCGKLATKVQKCAGSACATTCAQAGCS
jgi:hypothetical protein